MVYLTWSFPLLPGSSALLLHSLSFPLLSLSFVSCFLFLFPVVFLCLFNPFSLSISFHFFPLSLFCFSMLLYPLCSLSLSSTLFFLLVFYYRLPGCRVAGLPGTTAPLPSSLPLRLGLCALEATRIYCQSPRRKWESALHHSKSHPAVRRESVREGRVREERRSKSSRSGEVIRIQRCMMMQLLSTLATLLPPSLGFGTWPGSWLPCQKVVKGVQGTAPFGVPSERWATRRPGRQYL